MTNERDREKRAAARAALDYIEPGMTLGLGTGSTVDHFLEFLGERVAGGLSVRGVATSLRTAELAEGYGIPLLSLDETGGALDVVIDGADEVDRRLDMIKGGGGALLREKIVAESGRRGVFIADSTKLVDVLGAFPLPVEVVPFAANRLLPALKERGLSATLRARGGETFVTDNGNHIIDVLVETIEDPGGLHRELKAMTGVIETGLFVGIADVVLIGRGDGVETLTRAKD
ncbi:ribose-5-phosphate isomerase RpiA [bacterium]|nr:ribose-5-phosphate isomerase RpiA [bacterium]